MKMRSGKTRAGGDSRDRRAFTLIEMVIALGIVSFALLGMMALLPAGVQATKTSLEESGAIDVLSNVIADRKATIPTAASTYYGIPALTTAITTNFVPTNAACNSNYLVTCQIIPPASGSMDPYMAYLKVSWPPVMSSSTNAAGYAEQIITVPQP
jgi:prepilin-type N-terminal cleavage/methylation domain-containing protein